MKARRLRGAVVVAALLAASCASEPPAPPVTNLVAPLDFSYLLPLPLNVASLEIEDRYVPGAGPADLSARDPLPPIAALRAMAEQRLKAEGTSGKAVFVINDASLTSEGDVITGTMNVELDIVGASGTREGYAQATVTRQIAGVSGDLSPVLAQLTRDMMSKMNVEFEFQVRRNLGNWLLPVGAPTGAVETAPLSAPGAPAPPSVAGAGAPVSLAPPPQPMAPPTLGAPPPTPGLPPPAPEPLAPPPTPLTPPPA